MWKIQITLKETNHRLLDTSSKYLHLGHETREFELSLHVEQSSSSFFVMTHTSKVNYDSL